MDRNRSVNQDVPLKEKELPNPQRVDWEEQKLPAMRDYDPSTATAIYAVVAEPKASTEDWQGACRSFLVLVDLLAEQENSEYTELQTCLNHWIS